MFEHLFWQEGDQKQEAVAQKLAQFMEGARHSFHLAIFDFRLQEGVSQVLIYHPV